jgi:Xaa-Pro aminopeptidase
MNTNLLFTAEFFAGNRQRLRDAVQNAVPIVVTANGLLQRNADNTFPFQQDSSFWYLTGISEPDLMLVMHDGQEYLIVPGRSASREAFDGAVDAAELTRISGIKTVLDADTGWSKLAADVTKSKSVATPVAPAAYIEQYGMYTNPARLGLADRLRQHVKDINFIDIRAELATLRSIKQPAELEALQSAIDTTIDSLLLLTEPARFGGYHNEYEIEADLGREFRFRGASGHAFAPIIAGGKRACTLHNVANNGALQANSLVILDVGAEVSHYAADITRTKVYGTPTARQQEVFAAVLDVQTYALTLLKPGTLLKEYEAAVEKYMGQTLQKLQLIKTVDRESIRTYFPHSTSHFLGLDVHDVGDYTKPLEPGMVLTNEPGIYIPAEGIGVRLEDDVLITADGATVLSARLPKTLM